MVDRCNGSTNYSWALHLLARDTPAFESRERKSRVSFFPTVEDEFKGDEWIRERALYNSKRFRERRLKRRIWIMTRNRN